MEKKLLLVGILTFLAISSFGQFNEAAPWMQQLNKTTLAAKQTKGTSTKATAKEKYTFRQIQESFKNYYEGKDITKKGIGFKPFKRWENHWKHFVKEDGYLPNAAEMKALWDEKQQMQLATNSAANWEALGPTNFNQEYYTGLGRVNTIAIDPNDENKWYVGAPSGGFWKSNDAGATWFTTTDNFDQLGVSGIAIDPNNSNIIYIATGDDDHGDSLGQGVFKSLDGGLTWNVTGLNISTSPYQDEYGFYTMNEIFIDPNDSNTLWVGTAVGLYKTVDAGATWTHPIETGVVDFRLKPGDSNVLYVIAYNPETYLYNLYKSIDAGDSFTILSNGLPVGSSRAMLEVTPANPDLVYMITVDGYNYAFQGLYKSLDSGDTFQQTAYNGAGANWFQAWYDLSLTISPVDENVLLLGLIGIHRSEDGGETFTQAMDYYQPNNRFHADVHFLRYFNGKLFAGNDGGVFVSEDDGRFWQDKSFGLGITQYYKITVDKNDPNRIIGGTQDNGGLAYDNGNWISWHGGDGMDNVINPNNPNEIWGMTQLGGVLSKSSNFGQTTDYWAYPPTKPNGQSYTGLWETPVEMAADGTLYVAFENALFTIDQTNGWQKIGSDFNVSWIDEVRIDPNNPNSIYVIGRNKIWHSKNKGDSFSLLSAFNDTVSDLQIDPNDPETIYVSLGYSTNSKTYEEAPIVFKSTDGGLSFEDITHNLPRANWFVARLAVQGNHADQPLFLSDRLGKVYRLNQTTNTWEDYSEGLPQVFVTDMEINTQQGLLTIGTYGRGVWRTSIPTDVSFNPALIVLNNNIENGQILCDNPSPSFTLKNNTDLPFSNGSVQFFIDGALQIEESLPEINPNNESIISFDALQLPKGTHQLLINIIPENNSVFKVQQKSLTIFTNNFASSEQLFSFENDSEDWIAFDQDNLQESEWQRGSPTGSKLNSTADGSQAYGTSLSGPYSDNKKSVLVSPCYDFESIANPVLEFSMSFDLETLYDSYYGTFYYADILYFEYSIDQGQSWQLLKNSNDTENWFNSYATLDYEDPYYDYYCKNCIGGQWVGEQLEQKSYSFDFMAYANNGGIDLTQEKNIMFRFVFHSDLDTYYQSSNTFEGVVLDGFIIRGVQNDDDDDNDGILNDADNCPNNPNPDQEDADNDGIGDVCDEDSDNDGVLDSEDNCPLTPNPQQEDQDQDGVGDVCDDDLDNDGILDIDDNCDTVVNPDQADADNDGFGDLCDEDDDNDGILDVNDLCPFTADGNNNDNDGDGIGDICDEDDDNDGFLDNEDLCPFTASETNTDNDGDGIGDVCDDNDDNDNYLDEVDLCPFTADDNNNDNDGDGIGDICDDDDDNDGFLDTEDLCPFTASESNTDNDGDGIGDSCDPNDDNDNYLDEVDLCPLTADDNNADNDGDGIGDICDEDDDNDGYLDPVDLCPFTASASNDDNDLDGVGDICDPDDDNDNILDEVDTCPFIANTDQSDQDGDGLGDVCDDDSDNDGVMDIFDQCHDTPANSTVDVNGCPVFTLPTNNFALTTSSATCVDSNNGKISIVANEPYTYSATLKNSEGTEQTLDFTETSSFEDLEPGSYDVCIRIAEAPTYEQCFSIEITAPDALSVSSKIGISEEYITLQMDGGSTYYIELNGKTLETSASSVTLNLTQKENTLRIKTGLDCQGIYEETFIISDQLAIYPNPFSGNELKLYVGKGHESRSKISIYTLTGSLVFQHEQIHDGPQFTLQLNELAAGMYFMRLQNGQRTHQKKIIKK